MIPLRKIYFSAMLGALGGYLAAVFHQWLVLPLFVAVTTRREQIFLDILLGALIGAPIGFFPRFWDAIGRYSPAAAWKAGGIGALAGVLGGMLAIPVSEVLHHALGGGYVGRAISVSLLGLAIGCAAALFGGARYWRAISGGLAGGCIAGLLLEFLVRNFQHTDSSILALIILGFSISLAITLFVEVRPEAWLEGIAGPKVLGQFYHLGRFREDEEAIIGSSRRAYIWIPDALPTHAGLTVNAAGARLRKLHPKGEIAVNDVPATDQLLQNGDVVQIAGAHLRYRQRSRRHRPKVEFLTKTARGVH